MSRTSALMLVILFCAKGSSQKQPVADLTPEKLGNTTNVHACGQLYLAGQPTQADISVFADRGIKKVVSLRTDGEVDWDEGGELKKAGVEFIRIPFRSPADLTDEVFDKVRKTLKETKDPVVVHCGSANRVGAVWLAYRVLDEKVPLDVAVKEAKKVGLRSAAYEAKAQDYVKRKSTASTSEQSVRPGINNRFLDPEIKIDEWIERFERETREVFAAQTAIVKACKIRDGMRIADVGAGTGLFSRLFASAAGSQGWVYAVDISPAFLKHINQSLRDQQIKNLTAVLGADDSVNLPPESVDLVFVCDTYHHFEFPQSTLRSIHGSLRDRGQLIVIDFERIPGKSSEWTLNHVRAGKAEFRQEIEAAGFVLAEEPQVEGLQENYFLRFVKRPTK